MSPVLKKINKLDKTIVREKKNSQQILFKVDKLTKNAKNPKFHQNFERSLWSHGFVNRHDMITTLKSDVSNDIHGDDSYKAIDNKIYHRYDLDKPALDYVLKHPHKLYFMEAFGTDVSRGNEVKDDLGWDDVDNILTGLEKALKHNYIIPDDRVQPSN